MHNHLLKGLALMAALLAPVLATLYLNRRALDAAQSQDQVR
jgi:hypothetical protein